MIFGMSISAFTSLHVVLSLIGILTGMVVLFGMLGSKINTGWTLLFLGATVSTSVTGYFFPSDKILPSHIVGGISLVVLAIAILALYAYHLAGSWRWIYVTSAVIALYLNVFVLVAQGFLKVQFLKQLAPTQAEPPFAIAQGIVLLLFVALGIMAVRPFRPEAHDRTMAASRV
jgi:hypothetical protein